MSSMSKGHIVPLQLKSKNKPRVNILGAWFLDLQIGKQKQFQKWREKWINNPRWDDAKSVSCAKVSQANCASIQGQYEYKLILKI